MKILTSLILLLSFPAVSAQKNQKGEISYYVFNANGEPCKIEEGKFIGILEKLADTAWQWKYYNFTGPIISVETYSDIEMTTPAGYFAFFDNNGKIDSSGFVAEGKKDKIWYYFDDSLKIIQKEKFNQGVLLERKGREELYSSHKTDLTDSIKRDEREAYFKGGETQWRKYLEKNMKIPERTTKLSKNGTAVFSFVIATPNGCLPFIMVRL